MASFDVPDLEQQIDRVVGDLESEVPGLDAKIRRRFEHALARAVAGTSHGLHGRLGFIAEQILADTAESEFLARIAGVYGLTRKPPGNATGTLTVTGTAPASVPLGTEFQSGTGLVFVTDVLITFVGVDEDIDVAITAQEAGAESNLDDGTVLSLVSPIVDVVSDATIKDDGEGNGTTGGTDLETDDELRVRVLSRIQQAPSGGASGDYVNEALKVAGVTRAWEIPQHFGPGTVALLFVLDAQTPSILPGAGKITEVQAALDAFAPVTVVVTALAPTLLALDPTLATLAIDAGATLSVVEANITAELEDYVRRTADASGVTHFLSQINEAISSAAGEKDHTLSSPAADVVTAATVLLELGTITFP